MEEIKYCLFCGSETEYVPFDAGQVAIAEPWCEKCKIGFHRGNIKKALLRVHERWDFLVGNIDDEGNKK